LWTRMGKYGGGEKRKRIREERERGRERGVEEDRGGDVWIWVGTQTDRGGSMVWCNRVTTGGEGGDQG